MLPLAAPTVASATDTLDQQQTSHPIAVHVAGAPCCSLAQTFTAGLSGPLDRVELFLYNGSLTAPLKIEIRGVEGTGQPSAAVLASETVPASSVPAGGGFVPVTYAVPAQVFAGTRYAIVVYAVISGEGFGWGGGTGDPYPLGSSWGSTTSPPTTWDISFGSLDFAFKTYVTLAKHPTTTTVGCEPPTVVAGQPTKCTATVTDTATSGQTTPTGTVSFTTSGPGSFNKASCKLGTVNSSSASCSVIYTPGSTPSEPVRTDTLTATYEGDTTHEGSEGTTTVTVISPTALAHGSFVIGDQNATIGKVITFSDVEWWGSNWWKQNSLSGGPAPSSFKGFAESSPSPPTCGETWTTNTGNSSGPPPTVPEYMEVIAASKISQSGSTITGNAPEVVVVKTNPGYLPDPGHKGTGKVVAIVCKT
jgi:hypothetical protein